MQIVDEKLKERIKLIYERDKNSPLFLRVADFYLQNNEPQNAISVLENGLKTFPDHPLAYILMAKVKYSIGNSGATESYLNKANNILSSTRTFEFYKREFQLPVKQSSPFDSSRGSIFMNPNDDFVTDEDTAESNPKSVDDNLKQIAEKLMNSRITQSTEIPINENPQPEYQADKSKLVTETFANIYLSQGQKNEAIKIYEQLADRNPEKREYYLDKIRKVKSQ